MPPPPRPPTRPAISLNTPKFFSEVRHFITGSSFRPIALDILKKLKDTSLGDLRLGTLVAAICLIRKSRYKIEAAETFQYALSEEKSVNSMRPTISKKFVKKYAMNILLKVESTIFLNYNSTSQLNNADNLQPRMTHNINMFHLWR